jgi:hypothetical protein
MDWFFKEQRLRNGSIEETTMNAENLLASEKQLLEMGGE